MNARVERTVTDLSSFGYAEALGFENDIQRRKTVIYVFDAAFRRIVKLVD